MIIRYGDERDDESERGRILLFIQDRWEPDAAVTFDTLIELRCEIDRFVFSLLRANCHSHALTPPLEVKP